MDLPQGWEGVVSNGGFPLLSTGSTQPTLMHIGSFPLPAQRGSFGSGAVELMANSDVFMALVEYGEESANTPLFASQGVPRQLLSGDFDRDALQHAVPGQSGLQHFFTENGRAFCLYVVLGSHLDRFELVNRVNEVLASIEIS